jgi:nucleotide-binding universal stress UspA family protein
MKRILLPLQGFAAEISAVNLAFWLAEVSKAAILVMHCKEAEDEAQKSSLEQLLSHAKSLSTAMSISFDVKEVDEARAADGILDVAEKEKVDLIVMTASRERHHRQLLGSASRDVVRKGKIPTILVASWLEAFKEASESLVHKVLIPVADVAEDIAALRLAAALKKGSAARDAELIAFNATILPAIMPLTATDLPEFRRAKEKFQQSIEKFMRETGIKLTVKQTPARTAEQAIIEFANKEDVDFIILGGRRRPGTLGVFLGATTYKIATEAQAAVVLIYAP